MPRTKQTLDPSDARMQAALSELQALVRTHSPATTFTVAVGEDPEGVYLTASVDLEDPDEVMDLVVDLLLELQIDEGLPVYLIPIRTPARVAAMLTEQAGRHPSPDLPRLLRP